VEALDQQPSGWIIGVRRLNVLALEDDAKDDMAHPARKLPRVRRASHRLRKLPTAKARLQTFGVEFRWISQQWTMWLAYGGHKALFFSTIIERMRNEIAFAMNWENDDRSVNSRSATSSDSPKPASGVAEAMLFL
jgi:hypothetical protein